MTSRGEEVAPAKDAPAANERKISPELRAALEKLKLPGVKINLEEWSVDVDSRVCLKEGLLELIACTKDTKEHESIIVIDAKPSHVHTALLLIGAKPGSPAQRQAIDPEMTRFRDIPPSGSPVDVFLVFKDTDGKQVEIPISDFIKPADEPRRDPRNPLPTVIRRNSRPTPSYSPVRSSWARARDPANICATPMAM